MKNKFEILIFNDENVSVEVNFDKENDTVWISQSEMAELFEVDRTRITRHIIKCFW